MENKLEFSGKEIKYENFKMFIAMNSLFISIAYLASPERFGLLAFSIYFIMGIGIYFFINSMKNKPLTFLVEEGKLKCLNKNNVIFSTEIKDIKFLLLETNSEGKIFTKGYTFKFQVDKSEIPQINDFLSKYMSVKEANDENNINYREIAYVDYKWVYKIVRFLINISIVLYLIIGVIFRNNIESTILMLIIVGCIGVLWWINYSSIEEYEPKVSYGNLEISKTICKFNKTIDYNYAKKDEGRGAVSAIYLKFDGSYYCEGYILPNSIKAINISLYDCGAEFISYYPGEDGIFICYLPRKLLGDDKKFISKLKGFFPNASINIIKTEE